MAKLNKKLNGEFKVGEALWLPVLFSNEVKKFKEQGISKKRGNHLCGIKEIGCEAKKQSYIECFVSKTYKKGYNSNEYQSIKKILKQNKVPFKNEGEEILAEGILYKNSEIYYVESLEMLRKGNPTIYMIDIDGTIRYDIFDGLQLHLDRENEKNLFALGLKSSSSKKKIREKELFPRMLEINFQMFTSLVSLSSIKLKENTSQKEKNNKIKQKKIIKSVSKK